MAFMGHSPDKELRESRVLEIAPDIWMVEGYLSTEFFHKPPSSNCFVLRDEDLVLLVDTGLYPFYREPILKLLKRYRKMGCTRLVLVLSQGHFDHVGNNDIILEAGYDDVRFLLPEAEVTTLDIHSHWCGELKELQTYTNPFRHMPMQLPTLIPRVASYVSKGLAERMVSYSIRRLLRGVETLADRAVILPDESRVERSYGDTTFLGWEIGRFFAIHDATHSPGHLSIYDPEHKVLLTGDATLEINPAFLNSSLNRCITVMGQFRRLVEQGFVNLATDAHRSSIWAARVFDTMGCPPINDVQVADVLEGQARCAAFFAFYEAYYEGIKGEVLGALSRLKQATVRQLIEEFRATKNEYAQFKSLLVFPKVPSRLDVTVANVLREANLPRYKENGRIYHDGANGEL